MELKCINKNRDNHGKIVSYILTDKYDNKYEYTGIELKRSLKEGRVRVCNLQMDKLGRLIDKHDKNSLEDSKLIEMYNIIREKMRDDKYITEQELKQLVPELNLRNRVLKVIAQSEEIKASEKLAIIKYDFKNKEITVYTTSIDGARLAMKKIEEENKIYIWDLSLRAYTKVGNKFLGEMIGMDTLWKK